MVSFNFGDEEYNLHDSVSATCSITKGDLPLEIWWTVIEADDPDLVDKILATSDEIEIRKNKKISVLSIDSVKARNRGNYTCHARNKAGETSVSTQLAINGDSLMKYILYLLELFHPI